MFCKRSVCCLYPRGSYRKRFAAIPFPDGHARVFHDTFPSEAESKMCRQLWGCVQMQPVDQRDFQHSWTKLAAYQLQRAIFLGLKAQSEGMSGLEHVSRIEEGVKGPETEFPPQYRCHHMLLLDAVRLLKS